MSSLFSTANQPYTLHVGTVAGSAAAHLRDPYVQILHVPLESGR